MGMTTLQLVLASQYIISRWSVRHTTKENAPVSDVNSRRHQLIIKSGSICTTRFNREVLEIIFLLCFWIKFVLCIFCCRYYIWFWFICTCDSHIVKASIVVGSYVRRQLRWLTALLYLNIEGARASSTVLVYLWNLNEECTCTPYPTMTTVFSGTLYISEKNTSEGKECHIVLNIKQIYR